MTPPNAPTASEYHAFVPVAREGATIAEDILSTTATMRQSGTFATSSLCWSPAELELLAMFAVDAKSQLLAARRGEEEWQQVAAARQRQIDLLQADVEAAHAEASRVRDVHLRRHRRLSAALGLDDGYSVDATIDEAIRRAAHAATQGDDR